MNQRSQWFPDMPPFPGEEPEYTGNTPSPEPVIPLPIKDSDGACVFVVPVFYKNRRYPAIIFPRDWDELMNAGVSDRWFFLKGHGRTIGSVRSRHRKHYPDPCTVARIITQATFRKQIVKYRDHNPLNLRSDNLRLTDARK